MRVHEKMVRFEVRRKKRTYTVRLWLDAAVVTKPDQFREWAIKTCAVMYASDTAGIAEELNYAQGVNAVEVVDEHGNGDLWYPDWP